MHIPRAVLPPQDVSRLRDVGEQRVVTPMFPVMRIEATEGPLDLRAGRDHGAVDVNREPGKPASRHGLDDEIVIEFPRGARTSSA
jgi:hypothetical protein